RGRRFSGARKRGAPTMTLSGRELRAEILKRATQRTKAVALALLKSRTLWATVITILLCGTMTVLRAHAQGGAGGTVPLPRISLGVDTAKNPQDVAVTLQILLLMTVLTLAPSILIMTTAFTRLIIVFSILRSAMGTPQLPPNQVLVGLALFLTFFIMQPV